MSTRVRKPWPGLGLCLLLLASSPSSDASSGGPDALGTTWFDDGEGCGTEPPVFTGSVTRVADPVTALGPIPLGFAMPFAREIVSEAWISPTGFVAFSDQGAAGASPSSQLLPDPTPPNHLLAVSWRPDLAREIAYESFGDRFEIQWQFDSRFGTAPVWVSFARDGSIRMGSGLSPPDVRLATVGYEDAGGTRGSTYWRDGVEVEPGFPAPASPRSACLVPPALLDCSAALRLSCGDSALTDLPAAAAEQASVYSCTPALYSGNERVVELQVAEPSAVTVEIDSPALDLFRVAASPSCSEAACLDFADDSLSHPLLFEGLHVFVVDRLAAGGGDAVRVSSRCDPLPAIDCGGTASGTTLGGENRTTSHPCAPVALDGPESQLLLTTAARGHVAAVLDASAPGLWVVLRDANGACLAAGPGGAAAFDLPAGRYVITIDGEAGASGDWDLRVECGTRLSCAGAVPAACDTVLRGDNSRAPDARADLYACASGAVADGAEELWLLDNPREQVVTLGFLSRQPGQEAYLLDACDEASCRITTALGGCALLPAGEYLVAVDGPEGSEGAYELELACRRASSPGLDLRVAAIDASALSTDCLDRSVDSDLLVEVANDGELDATPPFQLLAFVDLDLSGAFEGGPPDLELGRLDVAASIPAGAQVPLALPARGELPFRDAVVHVLIDPEGLLAQTDRGNDLADTGRSCLGTAATAPLLARLDWEWSGSPMAPEFTEVEMTPIVADLTGDGLPEVLFTTQESSSGAGTGTLIRAVSGSDGSDLWAATDPALRVTYAGGLAVADLDGDGRPEILSQSFENPDRLLALDADGSLLWFSDPLPVRSPFDTYSGTPAIADLDGDGSGEVIWGPNAVAADGRLFWTPEAGGTLGVPRDQGGPISVVVDVDADGLQEVVAGPTAYRWNEVTGMGEILWTNPDVEDGFAAVGNFDGDAAPEIAIAATYDLYLLDGDTGALRWSRELPRGGGFPCGGFSGRAGGPPTVADFDGDGRTEIGVMVADLLSVWEGDGSLLWTAPMSECSSGTTSVTVFDFDGDGRPEVVAHDEIATRVLRGEDGAELLVLPGNSGTSTEMPVVADLDGDGHAEILVGENRLLGGGVPGGSFGLRAYESAATPWVGARPLWNQHAYHVSNVRDDLGLPAPGSYACLPPSPLSTGTFRVQRPVPRPGPLAPDLTLSLLAAEDLGVVACERRLRLDLRVGNGGGASAGQGSELAIYDGEPGAGGALLSSLGVADLRPGEWQDLRQDLVWPVGRPVAIWLREDDDGTGASRIVECREDNNGCVVTESEIGGGSPPEPPADVGPALRALGHGDPAAPMVTATFDWSLDAGAPRSLGTAPGEEHYHLLRGELWPPGPPAPPSMALVPGGEPWLTTSHEDATPRALDAELPRVHGYRVVAADACELESAD